MCHFSHFTKRKQNRQPNNNNNKIPTSTLLIVGALSLDLEETFNRTERERERERYTFHKETIMCISTHSSPGAESDFWPALLGREQRCYQKSDPGGDHYYAGCRLGQTRVSLPE